jgi:hypothetical protein
MPSSLSRSYCRGRTLPQPASPSRRAAALGRSRTRLAQLAKLGAVVDVAPSVALGSLLNPRPGEFRQLGRAGEVTHRCLELLERAVKHGTVLRSVGESES